MKKCIPNAEEGQELCNEILASTLDVSGSGIGREVVWRCPRSKRTMELHSQQNGTVIPIEDTWVWSTQNSIGIVRHGDSSEDIGSQPSEVENHGEEMYRTETSFTKLRSQTWENWICSRCKESEGNHCGWRRKRYLSSVERKRLVFARRPLQFPPRSPRPVRKKPEHTAATHSEPPTSRGRSVSRKRRIRGKSNHGSFLRQPCRYYLKGTCTRTPCEYWHPPECQFYKTETVCKAGDKCLFPHQEVGEQSNKKPKKGCFPKRRGKRGQRRCGYFWQAYHSWVVSGPLNGSRRIRAKQKLHRKLIGACKSSWSPIGSLKSSTLTIPWNLAKLVKISPGMIVRRHHTDRKQMVLLKEQCAEERKAPLLYCCNQVWMKVGGQILWNVKPICETSQIYYLMGRRHYERRFGQPFKGPIIPLGSLVEYHPVTAKDQSRIHQFGKKVLPGVFLGYALYAGWIWKGDVLIADLEELETMDASEINSKRLNAKEVIFPKQGEFIFPIAHGRIKTVGGDQHLRTSTLVRHRPIQGESKIYFLGESEGSLPPPHDSFPDAGEAIIDFWSMSGNFIYRHHVEPRVKLYSPRDESFPIPLKYIDVSKTTHTNLDVKARETHRWLLEYRWVTRLVRSLERFHTIYSIGRKKPPDGYVWSGRRWTRKQLTSRPDHLWPELWKSMGKHAELKEKQKWSNEKPHLENARKLRGDLFHWPWGQGVQRNH